jgi:hypothetical protein
MNRYGMILFEYIRNGWSLNIIPRIDHNEFWILLILQDLKYLLELIHDLALLSGLLWLVFALLDFKDRQMEVFLGWGEFVKYAFAS